MIAALLWLIDRVLPSRGHDWAHAMRAEIEAIADRRAARRFALGCLRAAVILRLRATLTSSMRGADVRGVPPRAVMIQVNAACAAAAIGVAYLMVAKAPVALIVVNTVAALLGVVLVAAALRGPRITPQLATLTTALIAVGLLATAVSGVTVDGATRWWRVGGMVIQTSLVGLPLAVVLFAQVANRWSTLAMVAIAVAVAMQPDRAMAATLCAGLFALLLVRRTPTVAVASAASAVAVVGTWLQADRLPAMPFVDHILWSSFQLHPALGVALWVGSALLVLPLLASSARRASPASLAGGACWTAVVASAAVGAYPTPVVGYGGAAILGYFLCLAALGAGAVTAHAADAPLAPSDARVDHTTDGMQPRVRHVDLRPARAT